MYSLNFQFLTSLTWYSWYLLNYIVLLLQIWIRNWRFQLQRWQPGLSWSSILRIGLSPTLLWDQQLQCTHLYDIHFFKVSSKYKTLSVTVQSFRAGGSQPVVREEVHEEVQGGMQQYFKIKTLQNNMPIGRPTLIRWFFNGKEILLISLTKVWKPLV